MLLAPPALAQTWAQENADPANRGRLFASAPDTLAGDRFTALDGRVITQPVEGPAELAIAATRAGTVHVLDALGETVWKADVDGPVRTAPTWTGEQVVVVPRSGTAHAFTLTGEEAWTVPVGNDRDSSRGEPIRLVRMASPIAYPGGGVVIADLEGQVKLVDDGEARWTYDFGEDLAVEATPAVTAEGDVIAAAFTPNQEGRGFLARIDGDTGTTDCEDCWRVNLGAQVVGAPTVTGDRVLVPLRDGDALQARSLGDGSLRWETAFDDSVPASPSLHEGLALVGDIRGTLRAVEVSGGKVAWTFNPLGDDPNAGELTTGQCSALTIADSVAVDAGGTAWVPYWKADICSGFPPQDSRESPFYLLDAETGEVLDRERYPKANHGPALLGNGVWVGSDEGGVRTYPHGSGIATHLRTSPGEAFLAINTDETGSWSISWDGNVTRSGEGRPPVFTTTELSPGEHRYRITAGDGTVTGTANVPAEDTTGGASSPDEQPAPANDTSTEDPEEPATRDEAPNESGDDDPGEDRPAPLGPLLALLAIGLAARRRARA